MASLSSISHKLIKKLGMLQLYIITWSVMNHDETSKISNNAIIEMSKDSLILQSDGLSSPQLGICKLLNSWNHDMFFIKEKETNQFLHKLRNKRQKLIRHKCYLFFSSFICNSFNFVFSAMTLNKSTKLLWSLNKKENKKIKLLFNIRIGISFSYMIVTLQYIYQCNTKY